MNKYGMKYSTIRFYQNESVQAYNWNGVKPGQHMLRNHEALKFKSARDIAYCSIMFAAVASPEELKSTILDSRS